MTFNFVFEPDYTRLMMAIIIDARASIPEIKNQIGSVIKNYVDSKIALINNESIVYKIERTDVGGVVVGVFSIQVNIKNKTANLITKVLRPAFIPFDTDLSSQIANFISLGEYKKDFLF